MFLLTMILPPAYRVIIKSLIEKIIAVTDVEGKKRWLTKATDISPEVIKSHDMGFLSRKV